MNFFIQQVVSIHLSPTLLLNLLEDQNKQLIQEIRDLLKEDLILDIVGEF